MDQLQLLDYEAVDKTVEYAVETGKCADGKHARRLGMIGVLSDSKSLYAKNAFGGATITDPWEALKKYKKILEEDEKVDLVLPLCHLYVPQDKKTCKMFDFPVVLSGHDHHVVDEVYDDSRLLKPGSDAKHAWILDLVWQSEDAEKPDIEAELVNCKDWDADEEIVKLNEESMGALDKLRNTEICRIPKKYLPMHSDDGRSQIVTAAHFIFDVLKEAVNYHDEESDMPTVDAVLISGGNVRGEIEYTEDHRSFTMDNLLSEMQDTLEGKVVKMPGDVLRKGLKETHAEASAGFMQFDSGVTLDDDGYPKTINGEELDDNKEYNILTTAWDIQDGASETWCKYYADQEIPEWDINFVSAFMRHCARHAWTKVYSMLDVNNDGNLSDDEIAKLDEDGDGKIDQQEMMDALEEVGYKADQEESSFVKYIFQVAGDPENDVYLTPKDIKRARNDRIKSKVLSEE